MLQHPNSLLWPLHWKGGHRSSAEGQLLSPFTALQQTFVISFSFSPPTFFFTFPECNLAHATTPFQSFCCFTHSTPTISSSLPLPSYTNIFILKNGHFLTVWQRPEFQVWLSVGKRSLPLGGLSVAAAELGLTSSKKFGRLSDCPRSISVAKWLHKHHLCRVGGKRQENELLHLYFFFLYFSTQGEDDWDVWWLRFTYSRNKTQRDASRRLLTLFAVPAPLPSLSCAILALPYALFDY